MRSMKISFSGRNEADEHPQQRIEHQDRGADQHDMRDHRQDRLRQHRRASVASDDGQLHGASARRSAPSTSTVRNEKAVNTATMASSTQASAEA